MHDSAASGPETAGSPEEAEPTPEEAAEPETPAEEPAEPEVPPEEAAPAPTIPGQRIPTHDDLVADPPPPPHRWRHRTVTAVVAVVTLLAVAAAITLAPSRPGNPVGSLGVAAAAATPTIPLTPYEEALKALNAQAAALTRHDHAGWMAAVDPHQPALRKHYEQLYSTFQALHVTFFEYHSSIGGKTDGPVEFNSEMVFCLSTKACSLDQEGNDSGPSHIGQYLTLKKSGDHYVISKAAKGKYPSQLEPYPWQAGDMVFRQGSRVTVGAPKSLASQMKTVLGIADKAARIDDRFAVMVGNPQLRYRVFLATDKDWKTWYGGNEATYAVAYTISTGSITSDVVLHMSELVGDRQQLKVVLQHEMGHVATISNLQSSDEADDWLIEGVADYIGWLPQHARQDWNFSAARDALHGSHPPKSIVEAPLKDNASDRTVARFYGLGHFSVECLATKYGEAKAMNFVRLKLRDSGYTLDDAAEKAFGTSFKTVDKGCLSWMKQHS
jgi:hypothetical protein